MEASYCRPINVFNFSSLWQQSQCQWKVLIMMDYRVMTHFPIFQVSCLHTNRLNNSKFRGNFGQRSNEKWMAWEALAQGSIFTPVSCELWESLLNLRVRESEEVLRDYFFLQGRYYTQTRRMWEAKTGLLSEHIVDDDHQLTKTKPTSLSWNFAQG